MTYSVLERGCGLRLDMPDTGIRILSFVDEDATRAALEPGRSILDRVAVEQGFLPRGCSLVTRPDHRRSRLLSAGTGKRPEHVILGAMLGFPMRGDLPGDGSITAEANLAARRFRPNEARRYDDLVDAVHAARGSRIRWPHVLLADVLVSVVVGDERRGAIRTRCQLHPDSGMGFYLYARGSRFHCFSCGAGGDQVGWAVHRYGLSRERAVRLVAGGA